MRILLDTNALFSNARLQGPHLQVLLIGGRAGLYQVFVPAVVLEELKRQVHKEIATLHGKLHSMARGLSTLVDREFSVMGPKTEEACAHYDKWLMDRLVSSRVQVVPIPDHPIGEYMKRELRGEKPYKDATGEGYRDDAIFETLISVSRAGAEPVLFVTNNSSDFADAAKSAVHPHLAARLRSAGVEPTQVILVSSIDVLAKDYLTRSLRRAEAYLAATASESWRVWIQQQLTSAGQDLVEGAAVPLPGGFSTAEYRAVPTFKRVDNVSVHEAWALPDGAVLLEVGADLIVQVTAQRVATASGSGWSALFDLMAILVTPELQMELRAALILSREKKVVSVSRVDLRTRNGAGSP